MLSVTFQVTFSSKVGGKTAKKNVQNILRMSEMAYSDKTKLRHYWIYRSKENDYRTTWVFFIINFDILLLLKVLYTGLLWEPLHGLCMRECMRQEDQINSNESWMLKQMMCQNVTYFLFFVSLVLCGIFMINLADMLSVRTKLN